MRVPINEIHVEANRRKAPKQIQVLADSIQQVGLIHPITVDQKHKLIAGLHRLEAARLLGWTDIDCTMSSLEGLEAELLEIDENFIHVNMTDVEYGDLLLRRKRVYEALHPETKAGVSQAAAMNRALGNNVECNLHPTSKSFVEDTAEKLGVNPSTIKRRIQTARDLTAETKEIIQNAGSRISKGAALKLSRLRPGQQEEAADQLASGKIRSVEEYRPAAPPPVCHGKESAVFKEIMADLQNSDKDFRCTPEILIAEVAELSERIQADLALFDTPYYEAVYTMLEPDQLYDLRRYMEAVCAAARKFIRHVEETVK